MSLDKHNHIVTYAANRIAERVGRTLVAPVVSFVPEGKFDPPDGNMRFPGTIGVSERVFEALLEDIARSLKLAGFRNIIFIGDHGLSQNSQRNVASRLTYQWRQAGVRLFHIASYYDDSEQRLMLKKQGESDDTIGSHAGLLDTSELSFARPASTYLDRLKDVKEPLATLGASGAPSKANGGLGERLINIRIDAAVKEITRLLAVQ